MLNAFFFQTPVDNYFLGHQVAEVYKDRVYDKFFAGKKVPGAEREIKLSLDRISAKNAWINRDRKALTAYFGK